MLLTGIMIRCFHHNTNDRLGAGLTHQNTPRIAQSLSYLNLTPQQWDTVDAAITAENISSIEYIRIAYKQGIIDAFSILRETL